MQVEFATPERVDRFETRRLLEPIGSIPPGEAQARCYAQTVAGSRRETGDHFLRNRLGIVPIQAGSSRPDRVRRLPIPDCREWPSPPSARAAAVVCRARGSRPRVGCLMTVPVAMAWVGRCPGSGAMPSPADHWARGPADRASRRLSRMRSSSPGIAGRSRHRSPRWLLAHRRPDRLPKAYRSRQFPR